MLVSGRVDLVRTWTLRIRKIRTVTPSTATGELMVKRVFRWLSTLEIHETGSQTLEIVYLDLLDWWSEQVKHISAKMGVGLLVISHGAIRKRSQTKQIQAYIPYRRGGKWKAWVFAEDFRFSISWLCSQLSHKRKLSYFTWNTGCLMGILMMVDFNPYIPG